MESSATRPAGSGWFDFAGVMFVIAGAANILWGIGALSDKEYLPEDGLLFSTLTLWGWLAIIWGVAGLITAYLVLSRATSGVILGVIVASISAIFWFFALPVLPIFALTVIAIDVLIIYGLTAHADAAR